MTFFRSDGGGAFTLVPSLTMPLTKVSPVQPILYHGINIMQPFTDQLVAVALVLIY